MSLRAPFGATRCSRGSRDEDRTAIVLATIAALAQAPAATALPTMVRLAYGDCAACHVSPQGGGPLTVYGRGIDQSQSLRGGETHAVADDALTKA